MKRQLARTMTRRGASELIQALRGFIPGGSVRVFGLEPSSDGESFVVYLDTGKRRMVGEVTLVSLSSFIHGWEAGRIEE